MNSYTEREKERGREIEEDKERFINRDKERWTTGVSLEIKPANTVRKRLSFLQFRKGTELVTSSVMVHDHLLSLSGRYVGAQMLAGFSFMGYHYTVT